MTGAAHLGLPVAKRTGGYCFVPDEGKQLLRAQVKRLIAPGDRTADAAAAQAGPALYKGEPAAAMDERLTLKRFANRLADISVSSQTYRLDKVTSVRGVSHRVTGHYSIDTVIRRCDGEKGHINAVGGAFEVVVRSRKSVNTISSRPWRWHRVRATARNTSTGGWGNCVIFQGSHQGHIVLLTAGLQGLGKTGKQRKRR